MPETRLARTRASLPEGYQHPTQPCGCPDRCGCLKCAERRLGSFGNLPRITIGDTTVFTFPSWRAPHLNAAEQLRRRAFESNRDLGDES